MRISLKQLRSLINEVKPVMPAKLKKGKKPEQTQSVIPTGQQYIPAEELGQIVPAALAAMEANLDEEERDPIWIMWNKPVNQGDEDDDESDDWSETNEPELAAMLADLLKEVSVKVNGQRVVILCGTDDDEYGYFWDNKNQEWSSYSF